MTLGNIEKDQDSARITEPELGLRRQILAHTPSMMLVRHEMSQGWRGAAHKHPHEQMVYVVSGRLQFSSNGVLFNVAAGDNFIVPPNVEHHATAMEDSVVLDIFNPPREDYL